MYKNKSKYIILLMVLFFSSLSSATLVHWEATIDGSQEIPAKSSVATGQGVGTLDTSSGLLNWDISWAGVVKPTLMHFHGAAEPGVIAGVRVNIGLISGLTSHSGSETINSTLVNEVLDGLWYINIHSEAFPGGEIRGQVIVNTVPVPAAVWLFCSALMGLVGMNGNRNLALSKV